MLEYKLTDDDAGLGSGLQWPAVISGSERGRDGDNPGGSQQIPSQDSPGSGETR